MSCMLCQYIYNDKCSLQSNKKWTRTQQADGHTINSRVQALNQLKFTVFKKKQNESMSHYNEQANTFFYIPLIAQCKISLFNTSKLEVTKYVHKKKNQVTRRGATAEFGYFVIIYVDLLYLDLGVYMLKAK